MTPASRVGEMLSVLRESHPDIFEIFTRGSCFELCRLLRTLEPGTVPLYSHREGHWIAALPGDGVDRFFDIGGEISPDYVRDRGYERQDPVTLASAGVVKAGRSGHYDKYLNPPDAWSAREIIFR